MDTKAHDKLKDRLWKIVRAVIEEAHSRYGLELYATISKSDTHPYLLAMKYRTEQYTFMVPVGLHALMLETEQMEKYLINKCNDMVRDMVAHEAKEKRSQTSLVK